ncbi:MAG: ribosomal protein S18 acetylase RimI-like enzyme [Sulfitobacter sp.]|jgi:ribosomal protein S18 acetylase RimI-like enzyme
MIRLAQPSDSARVQAIAAEAYAPYTPLIGRPAAPAVADYGARIAAGQTNVYEVDGLIAGYVVAFALDGAWELDAVGVDPAYQGQGIGGALIEHCEADAQTNGCSAVTLYTNVMMTANLTLYPSLGYVSTGRRTVDGYDRVYFRKDLL